MDIKEASEAKKELEKTINQAIQDFQARTGARVTNLNQHVIDRSTARDLNNRSVFVTVECVIP